MNAGLQLKLLRKQNGYSREEVAKELGISVNTISNYERNRTPIPISVMIKLSRLYDFDVFTVLGVRDPFLKHDKPIYYYFKAHFEYLVRREREKDLSFGNVLPDGYYAGRLKNHIIECINDPTFIKNYPDAAAEARKDLKL